jgi:hypothetical protein
LSAAIQVEAKPGRSMRRHLLVFQLAAFAAVGLWVYASHRYNGLLGGGMPGDVDFWIRMGDIGFVFGVALWAANIILAGYWACVRRLGGLAEGAGWVALALFVAPVFCYGFALLLMSGAHPA